MTKQSGIPAGVAPCKSAALDPRSKCTRAGVSHPAPRATLPYRSATARIARDASLVACPNEINSSFLGGQTVPSFRADDSVRDETLLELKLLHRQLSRGAKIAIDRYIETVCTEPALQADYPIAIFAAMQYWPRVISRGVYSRSLLV